MEGALAGIRVLDLSRVLAGPWATQLLADMGADVVKVEHPDGGDDTRSWAPPAMHDSDGNAEAAYFLAANRGKRSICIDIARPEGQGLVRALAASADVLVENFKLGGLARYGLDHETLCAANPGLVYCSISGFGRTGPRAAEPGYDFVMQGMTGLMSVTGETDGEPVKVGVALIDVMTGLYAANAIQAALLHRERTGRGQHIDLALFDVGIATLANQALNYLVTGRNPGRLGNAHPNIVPYQTLPTSDGQITVAVGNDRQFRDLCAVLGEPMLADDPAFATNADRVAHRAPLVARLSALTAGRAAGELIAALGAALVPAGPVNRIADAFADPQALHRGAAISLPHRTLGSVPGVACPIRFGLTPVDYRRGPPVLGEHGFEILSEKLGLGGDEIAALEASGAVRHATPPAASRHTPHITDLERVKA